MTMYYYIGYNIIISGHMPTNFIAKYVPFGIIYNFIYLAL